MIIKNKENYVIIKPTNNSSASFKPIITSFFAIELSLIVFLFAPVLYLSIKSTKKKNSRNVNSCPYLSQILDKQGI